jgi:general transcription factor 3C polypeptide 5 (transcription factor C subunit 1)
MKELRQRFQERPVWTRASIMNQFTAHEARDIHKSASVLFSRNTQLTTCTFSSKILLPLVSYVFSDGPWRDCLIRFGYDPRADIGARL